MIRKELLQQAVSQLTLSETPLLDAEILLSEVLGYSRSVLKAFPEKEVPDAEQQKFLQWIERRKVGEPIAYILGYKDFWTLRLIVSKDVLVPRPETELLVELVLNKIPAQASYRILDLGTGSGAIALALGQERPRCEIVAVDSSAAALKIARMNAEQLGICNVYFVEGDWFAQLDQKSAFNIIVSNPPYIDLNDQHLQRGGVQFEPRCALVAKENGLADLKYIVEQARYHLQADGWLLLEHGYNQEKEIWQQFHQFGYESIICSQDLAGIPRVTEGRYCANI